MSNYFSVIYGDSWLNINFSNIVRNFLNSKKSGLITIINKKYVDHSANILIKKKKIVRYSKKNNKNFNYIDYGFLIFEKNVFNKFRAKKFDLSKVFDYLVKNKNLEYQVVSKKFYQIGNPKGISDFRKYFEK